MGAEIVGSAETVYASVSFGEVSLFPSVTFTLTIPPLTGLLGLQVNRLDVQAEHPREVEKSQVQWA